MEPRRRNLSRRNIHASVTGVFGSGPAAYSLPLLAQNQAWLQGYLTKLNLPPGEPLFRMTSDMGVTRAEYHALSEAYEHPIIKSLRASTQLEVVAERSAA